MKFRNNIWIYIDKKLTQTLAQLSKKSQLTQPGLYQKENFIF